MTLHYTRTEIAEWALNPHASLTLRGVAEDWLALHAENERLRAALIHERDCGWCGNMCGDRHGECEGCTLEAALKGQP